MTAPLKDAPLGVPLAHRLAEDLVSAVAGAPIRTRRGKKTSSQVGGRLGTLTNGSSNLLAEISESAAPGKNLRGVFYHDSQSKTQDAAEGSTSPSEAFRSRPVDFRQRLDLILVTESNARAVARKLYQHFEGETARLPALLQLLEERWGFPERVFPLLWTHMQRATCYVDDLLHIEEDEWAEAFVRWLQVVRTRCERTKMSRQCFVQTQSGADRAKVYLQGAKLGEGSYGEVYMAFHRDLGVDRVVKCVPKAQLGMAEEQVEDEVNTLKSLDHPHIVRIFEAFETEERLHIVMDYAEGGDLASAIRIAQDAGTALPETWTRDVARQVSSALEHIHSKGMIHCDLKPGNTMLLRRFDLEEAKEGNSRPHALLADFGLAEIFEERPVGGAPTQVKGTPSYLAPEGFEGRVNHKSDMWALGIMIFEMLQGYRPFRGTSNVFMLFCSIANTEPSLEGMPPLAQDLVKALLAKDPKVRPLASECCQSAWFLERQPAPRRASVLLQPSGLQTLGHDSYFHRAVTFCVASALGMKQMLELFEVFQAMDLDSSGYLSAEQLSQGLMYFGIQQDPVALMAILDLDGDSRISITEFLAGALQLKDGASDKEIQYAFGIFDLDGDGYISMDELRVMLSGDGPLSDVLPDGQTTEQVMEEVSGGVGQISFADFRAYLTKQGRDHPPASNAAYAKLREAVATQDPVNALVHDLEQEGSYSSTEDLRQEFPSFHTWLADLFEETQQSAGFNSLLIFVDRKLEAAYVAHYIRSTCQQLFLLALCLVCYALWSLTTESWTWDPALAYWDHPPQVTHHLAWLLLTASGIAVMCLCIVSLRRTERQARKEVCTHKDLDTEKDKEKEKEKDKEIGVRDVQAVRLEFLLCAWACMVQWVGCFFANRFRVSAMYGANADEMFNSVNSDYDLIVSMIGMIMFFSTRTHVRFVCILPIAASCVLAYALTSTFLGVADSRNRDEKNWAWPAILLIIMMGLCLSGHRAVEYHRRLTFLSLYASYSVLREVQEGQLEVPDFSTTKDSGPGSFEMRSAKIKQSLDFVRRLNDSGELANRPLKAAMQSMVEVLQSTREELIQVEKMLATDVEMKLRQRGIEDISTELLLNLFDTLPSVEFRAQRMSKTKELKPLDLGAATAGTAGGWEGISLDLDASRPWGWETLSGSTAPSPEATRQLAVLGGTLLVPAVAAAAATGGGHHSAEAARQQARHLLEELLEHYARGPRSAEARAALSLQAAHWLAHRLGLWGLLSPWERVALLVAALGLHSGAASESQRSCGSLIGLDPLLGHAAGANRTLTALDNSGLGDASAGEHSASLRVLVRRFLGWARPRCVLENIRRMRAHFERDDQVPSAQAERGVFTTLVLAAADLSFLALPPSLHRPWALLCQAEAQEAQLEDYAWMDDIPAFDVASWLRGLAEVLAVPLYETMGLLGGAEGHLAVPLRHLRENAKHWRFARLLVAPGRTSAIRVSTMGTTSSSSSIYASQAEGLPCRMPLHEESAQETQEDREETQAQTQAIGATQTLLGEPTLGPPTLVLDPLGATMAARLSERTPGDEDAPCETLDIATLPAGVLPAGVGTLKISPTATGKTSPPGTLKVSPPGSVGGTLPPCSLALAGTLKASASASGISIVDGAPMTRTIAPGMLDEARQGEAGQQPVVGDASLRSGHSAALVMAPRAKLPGEVSPLSDSESVEDERR